MTLKDNTNLHFTPAWEIDRTDTDIGGVDRDVYHSTNKNTLISLRDNLNVNSPVYKIYNDTQANFTYITFI